jgi:hypothetical protein
MRVALGLAAALATLTGGCRSDEQLAGPDLSSQAYYCPANPPADDAFTCDPTAIPYCTYPGLQLTCSCVTVADGRHALLCPVDMAATD